MAESQDLIDACNGCHEALNRLFSVHSPQLQRMINLRLDARLRARVSAEDILQDTYCLVFERLQHFCENQSVPFHIWLRSQTAEQLIAARRHHLGVQKRTANAEVSIGRSELPQVDTASIARQLIGKFTSPTQAALRSEIQQAVQLALNEMDVIDREIIVLRHFENLTNNEAAMLLRLHKATASKRYVSALKRLHSIMSSGDRA